MRASPPLLVLLNGFRAWRAGVAVVATLACAAWLAWCITAPASRAAWSAVIGATGVLGIALALRWLWSVPTRPVQLLWDGRYWHVSAVSTAGSEASSAIGHTATGRLDIAIDLGGWMLLKFRPDTGEASTRSRHPPMWLPAERAAAPNEWHALRYTLHGNAHRGRVGSPAPTGEPRA